MGAILAVFMGGLGAGRSVAGRTIPRLNRLLRGYGWLELATGTAARALPQLLPDDRAGRPRGRNRGRAPAARLRLARLVRVALLLGAPTLCLGATFPVTGAGHPRHPGAGRDAVGRLYAANLAGGVLGTLAASFALLPAIGVTRTGAGPAASGNGWPRSYGATTVSVGRCDGSSPCASTESPTRRPGRSTWARSACWPTSRCSSTGCGVTVGAAKRLVATVIHGFEDSEITTS